MSRRYHFFARNFCLAGLVMATRISAPGATILWTNTSGGNWGAASNWSPNQIPGASDTALITANGTYLVTVSASIQVAGLTVGGASGTQSLTVAGSTLSLPNGGTVGTNAVLTLSGSTLAGGLSVSGVLNWTNGVTMAGGSSVTILSNAILNITGRYTEYLSGMLTNGGTVNWSGTGDLGLYSAAGPGYDGGIVNLPGALFNVQNDQTVGSQEGSPVFVNEGTLRKSGGTNSTVIGVLFTNSGVMDLASGTVTLSAGGTDSGTLTGGGNLSVTAGTLTISSAAQNLILAGGTINGVNATISNLTWSSGTFQGASTVTGTANWTGGTIAGASSLTVAGNAVLNISGNYSVYLYGVLTNAGTVNWSGAVDLELYSAASQGYDGGIVNLPGALFNVQNDHTLGSEQGSPFFVNEGTFLKSAGTNSTSVGVLFTNSGVVDVATGTVTLSAGGTDSGTLSGTGNLSVTGGTLTISTAAQNVILAGGTINGVNASISNLTWSSGTLQGAATVTRVANWTGGTIGSASSLTVASNAVLNISGSYSVYLNGMLTNAGTVNWSGTESIELYNYGSYNGGIVNLAGALFNVQNDQVMTAGGGTPFFSNAGTFLKSAGTNSSSIGVLFTNSGVVDVATGTVTLSAGGMDSGTMTGTGNLSVTGGTLTISSAAQNLILAGGTIIGVNASISNLTWSSGTLQGAATVTRVANWTGGTIGSASSLTVASNAVLNISGSYSVYLNGMLTNAGTVNWSGTENIELYNYGVYNGGIVNLPGALFNVQNDQTMSAGGGSPIFNNAGTFLKSAGTNTTIGLTFNNTGTLNLSIYSRTSFGQINFSGNQALSGAMTINFNNTYSPATGDSFPLLTYGSESGVFSAVNLPAPAPWETNSLTYGPTVFRLAVGSLYNLAFTAGPAATNIAGATFAPVVVQAEYLNGNPLATNGAPITISMTGGNGTLSGTLTQNTDATGKATFTNLSINLAGPKTLQASSPPWITPASSSVMITPAAAAQLLIVTPITSLQIQGYPFSPPPVVQVRDSFGNIVSNSTVLISAQSSSSGGGALRGTTAVNASGTNGLGTLGSLYYSLGNPHVAETVTIYYTSPGLISVTNNPVMVEFVSGQITLTNGNSMVQIDPNSQNGVFAWKVDGIDQLSQHWFWLRQDPTNAQISFDQLGTPLGLTWTPTNATFNYLPRGLNVTLSFTLNGGAAGSHASSVAETISIQNTNNSALGLHVYDYTDFDLNGEAGGDTVSFPTANLAVQQGKGATATQSVQGQTPSYWEASWYAVALDTIENATPAILADDINPSQAGDQTFAYQWDTNLMAGQTLILNLTNTIQSAEVILSIARSGTNIVVSWPTNSAAGFNLQSGGLSLGRVWADVLTPPATVGSNYQITLPVSANAQFYRLKD